MCKKEKTGKKIFADDVDRFLDWSFGVRGGGKIYFPSLEEVSSPDYEPVGNDD